MAAPTKVPGQLLWHMPWVEQPSYTMGRPLHQRRYPLPPHPPYHQPPPLAPRTGRPRRRLRHLSPQMRLLLRGRPPRVPPPRPRQLLLRPVDRLHVPRHRRAPSFVPDRGLHPALWCGFMAPEALLELRIYGEWLSGERRRLSKVANPSSHLSVVGNFVGAILAARVGWKEAAKFFWAVGFAHYMVVFVTLYQRLPSSEALPKELHPVFSMFIAAPSAASIAWQAIYGEFEGLSRTCYFIALFLYISLVVRINFFLGFRFSVAWWSYTFPMTTASLATIKYAENVPCLISRGLVLTLSFMSSTMVSVLFVSTLLHAFIWQSIFPNDLAIAITNKKIMPPGKEKRGGKRPYDIRRWTKQSPLSFVSSTAKGSHRGVKEQDTPENKLEPDT